MNTSQMPPAHLRIVSLPLMYLRRTPPSSEALRHSGGARRLCTSPTVTLYLEVELRRDRRPGTEQKTSAGLDTPPRPRPSLVRDKAETAEPLSFEGTGTVQRNRKSFSGRITANHRRVTSCFYESVTICAFGFGLLLRPF